MEPVKHKKIKLEKPNDVGYRCTFYKKCIGYGKLFRCTYIKKEGIPFKNKPNCFREYKK